jgi:hypothetical protein
MCRLFSLLATVCPGGTKPGLRLRGASVGYRGDRLLLTDVISTPCVSAGMKGTSSTQFGGRRRDSLPVSF